MSEQYWLTLSKINSVRAEVDRLNAKFGTNASLTIGDMQLKDVEIAESSDWWANVSTIKVQMYPVTVDFPALGGNGYKLIAKLEDGMVREVPGQKCPKSFWTVDPTRCDLCNVKHVRTKSYVVFNGISADFVVVGGSCLSDLLGKDANSMLAAAECFFHVLDDIVEPEEPHNKHLAVDFDIMIKLLIKVTTKYGYVSGKAAWEDPSKVATKERILEALFDAKQYDDVAVTEDDIVEYVNIVCDEYYEQFNADQTNAYLFNMLQLLDKDYIATKDFGYFASLHNGYLKATDTKPKMTPFPSSCLGILTNYEFKVDHSAMPFAKFESKFGVATFVKGWIVIDGEEYYATLKLGTNRKNFLQEMALVEDSKVVIVRGKVEIVPKYGNQFGKVMKVTEAI